MECLQFWSQKADEPFSRKESWTSKHSIIDSICGVAFDVVKCHRKREWERTCKRNQSVDILSSCFCSLWSRCLNCHLQTLAPVDSRWSLWVGAQHMPATSHSTTPVRYGGNGLNWKQVNLQILWVKPGRTTLCVWGLWHKFLGSDCVQPKGGKLCFYIHLFWSFCVFSLRLDPDLRSVVYCTGVRNGGINEWNHIMDRYNYNYTMFIAHEKNMLLYALSCSKEQWIQNM